MPFVERSENRSADMGVNGAGISIMFDWEDKGGGATMRVRVSERYKVKFVFFSETPVNP